MLIRPAGGEEVTGESSMKINIGPINYYWALLRITRTVIAYLLQGWLVLTNVHTWTARLEQGRAIYEHRVGGYTDGAIKVQCKMKVNHSLLQIRDFIVCHRPLSRPRYGWLAASSQRVMAAPDTTHSKTSNSSPNSGTPYQPDLQVSAFIRNRRHIARSKYYRLHFHTQLWFSQRVSSRQSEQYKMIRDGQVSSWLLVSLGPVSHQLVIDI